jgi:DHA1 family tetracycline resistance protein-like MFS transporter
MMFAIIFFNLFGSCVSATLQSIISSSVDAKSQGKTLGLVSGINSLMAVMAPLIGAPLLGLVSDLPKGDWRLGTPFYFCAALQALALVLATLHFRGSHQLTHSSQVKDPPHG